MTTFPDRKLTNLLYVFEGAGLVFIIFFLAAYLGGLPTTNVLHNQPAFRIPLAVFGGAILVLVLVTCVLAVKYRGHTEKP